QPERLAPYHSSACSVTYPSPSTGRAGAAGLNDSCGRGTVLKPPAGSPGLGNCTRPSDTCLTASRVISLTTLVVTGVLVAACTTTSATNKTTIMATIAHSGQSCAIPSSTAPTCSTALAAAVPLLTRFRDSGVDTAALAAICSTMRTRSESKISRA